MKTRLDRIKAYAGRLSGREEGLEGMGDERAPMFKWIERSGTARDDEKELARQAVRKLARNEDIRPAEMDAFEAIIYPEGRPVVDIVNDSFANLLEPWVHLGQGAARQKIEAAIPALGRIEIPEHPRLPYAGTGFLVGDDLIMTNRHVAELFAEGLGEQDLSFRSGLDVVEIDFKREINFTAPQPFRIQEVVMVHPYWDMALLRVQGLEGRTALTLGALSPEDLKDRDVVVIGYPAQDPRNDIALQNRIFRDIFQVKRLQPGKVMGQAPTRSFGNIVSALTHDSSTLGGNSGSAVLDVTTGNVVALHFGGRFFEANYGVPAYELKRDGRVVDAGVKFTSDVVPDSVPWTSAWRRVEGVASPPRPDQADASGDTDGQKGAQHFQSAVTDGGVLHLTVPLQIQISIGQATLNGGGLTLGSGTSRRPSRTSGPRLLAGQLDVQEARRRAQGFNPARYFDAAADQQDRSAYYQDLDTAAPPAEIWDTLNRLLSSTHHTKLKYNPSRYLYPVVDRQSDGRLTSLYSASRHSFTFEEILQADQEVFEARQEAIAEMPLESLSADIIEAIEANNPFNCEHVVPQSWFNKREPMRGDLNHLFACESGCNSFRGNKAYFQFEEEAVRQDCGQSADNRFQPGAGRGAAARATFYFLVRYAGLVGAAEMPRERLGTLLRWHRESPVDDWERHRNQVIFSMQGNRNPFIDFPELAARLDFRRGVGQGKGRAPRVNELPAELEALVP
jgi:endonuclease I/V8-like Glu-specific endopeptidase